MKGYRKIAGSGGEDAIEYAKRMDFLRSSKEYMHYLIMDYYKPLIDSYYDMGKKSEGDEQIRIKREENALRREFVDLIHAVDDGKEIDIDASVRSMLEEQAQSGNAEIQKKAQSVLKNKYQKRDGGDLNAATH